MNRRAVLYARVSSDDVRAGKEGRNLAEQLRECREFAQAKGYKIVAELQEDDRGASGASMDLPQYKRFLSMAQVGEFDVLIVRELDRLARDLVKQLLTEHELKLAGVGVEYVRGDYAPTPEGKISKNINAAVAEYERDKIRERTMRAKRVMAERGNIVTPGHGPFGYRIVKEGGKTRLEIDPELAKVVRLIFTLCSQGKSIRSIAAELTRLAFPSPADHYPPSAYSRKISKRCEWGRAAIHQILKNKAYIGSW